MGNIDKVVCYIILIKVLWLILDKVIQVKVFYNYMLSWLIKKL